MRKIKYIGCPERDCVEVNTMETARTSGPGYVKRLLDLFKAPYEPWPTVKIEFELKANPLSISYVRFHNATICFHWEIFSRMSEKARGIKERNEGLYILKVVVYGQETRYKALDIKEQFDKTIVKDILETLI